MRPDRLNQVTKFVLMEIPVLSATWIKELLEYGKTRLPIRIFAPLAIFLLAAAYANAWPEAWQIHFTNVFLVVGLLTQFRLWDDLCDIEEDRIRYPDRVLCSSVHIKKYQLLVFGFFLANSAIILLGKSIWLLLVFAAINAAFLLFYWIVQRRKISLHLRYHFVLIKYPLFVLILGANGSSMQLDQPLLYAGALVYLGLCIYELLDDQRLVQHSVSNYLFGIEFATALLFGMLMFRDLSGMESNIAYIFLSLLAVGILFALVVFYRQYQSNESSIFASISFLIFFCWILYFTLARNLGPSNQANDLTALQSDPQTICHDTDSHFKNHRGSYSPDCGLCLLAITFEK